MPEKKGKKRRRSKTLQLHSLVHFRTSMHYYFVPGIVLVPGITLTNKTTSIPDLIGETFCRRQKTWFPFILAVLLSF